MVCDVDWCGFVLFVSFVCEHKFYGAETLLAVFTFVFKHAVNLKISLSCKNIFSLFIFSYLLCCCYYYAQLFFFVEMDFYDNSMLSLIQCELNGV